MQAFRGHMHTIGWEAMQWQSPDSSSIIPYLLVPGPWFAQFVDRAIELALTNAFLVKQDLPALPSTQVLPQLIPVPVQDSHVCDIVLHVTGPSIGDRPQLPVHVLHVLRPASHLLT